MSATVHKETRTIKFEKPKSRNTCCWIGVGIFGLAVLIAAGQMIFSMFSDGNTKEPDLSKYPTTQTSTQTSKPDTSVNTSSKPNDTTLEQNQSAPTNNESANDPTYPKEDVINFFVDAAVKNTNGTPSPLGRFAKSTINLKVIGTIPNQASADTLKRVIDDFNGISQSVKLQRNDNGSDLQVFFVPINEFGNYTNSPGDHQGFSVTVPDSECQFKYSKAYIANDSDINQDTRDYIIRHEIMHALGFSGHNEPTSGSIMGNRLKQEHTGELDIKLYNMLYNSGVPLCSNEPQVREFFAGREL